MSRSVAAIALRATSISRVSVPSPLHPAPNSQLATQYGFAVLNNSRAPVRSTTMPTNPGTRTRQCRGLSRDDPGVGQKVGNVAIAVSSWTHLCTRSASSEQ